SSRAKLGRKASGFARPDFSGHSAERYPYPPATDPHGGETQKNSSGEKNDHKDVPRGPELPKIWEIQMMQSFVEPAVDASRTFVARNQGSTLDVDVQPRLLGIVKLQAQHRKRPMPFAI